MNRFLGGSRLWVITLLMALGLGLPAAAVAGGYSVSVAGGVSLTHSSPNSGFSNSIGTGAVFAISGAYSLLDLVQLEVTGAYHSPYSFRTSHDQPATDPAIRGFTSNSRNSSFSLIPAVRLSVPVMLIANVYGLAGVGVSFNQSTGGSFSYQSADGAVSGTYRDASTTQLAYSFGAGVSASLLDSLLLDVGYRYTDLGSFKSVVLTSSSTAALPSFIAAADLRHPRTHDLLLTVGYRF
ncbi:MAG: outer membrane beta-barrel protein [Alphaproteobacteria bacterium]|nr:outer membrane beta-barrel protein [Alphaproteobacteria bacterium]